MPPTFGLVERLDAQLAVDWTGAADDDLDAELIELQTVQNKLDALKAKVTGEWDGRRVWARQGCVNGATWLAATLRLPSDVASRQVRHARHLRKLRGLLDALADGSIDSNHIQRIVSADTPRTHDALVEDEAQIVASARTDSWRQFCRTLAEWVEDNDPDGPHRDRGERRRFHFSQTFQDGWATDGWFDPINGTIVHTELERLEQHLFETDWAQAKERLGRDPLPGELARTPAQRRADALVEMARRSASADEHGRRPEPLVVILVGVEGFARSCELLDGTVLSPSISPTSSRNPPSSGSPSTAPTTPSAPAGNARSPACYAASSTSATGGAPTRSATSPPNAARATTRSPMPPADPPAPTTDASNAATTTASATAATTTRHPERNGSVQRSAPTQGQCRRAAAAPMEVASSCILGGREGAW
jgi:hypothetical protein